MADLAPQLIAAIKGDKGFYPDVDYSAAKSYRKDTVLKYNGSQWRALQLVPAGTTPAEGAYWTRFIDGTPIADAAQVAADRVLSQAAAATATAKEASVSAMALQVGGYTTAAQIAAQSAAAVSGLANLGATYRALALDPNTIAVFVYDTSRDDDRGAWVRKINNSMINEPLNTANRGAVRDAQTMVFIVVTTTGLSLYSADDPLAPLWTKFIDGGLAATSYAFYGGSFSLATHVSALNGAITVCTANGFWIIDVIGDTVNRFLSNPSSSSGQFLGSLADRNIGNGMEALSARYLGGPRVSIINNNVNQALLFTAPHTPLNVARFGLPNPTVVLATEGGISVIRHDGTVANSAATTAVNKIAIAPDLTIYGKMNGGNSTLFIFPFPSYLINNFASSFLNGATFPATMYGSGSVGGVAAAAALSNGAFAFGANIAGGLSIFYPSPSGLVSLGAIEYVTDKYRTGRQYGAIKFAGGESIKMTTPLTGASIYTNGFTGAGDLASVVLNSATASASGGVMTVTANAAGAYPGGRVTLTTVPGETYRFACQQKRNTTLGTRFVAQDVGTAILLQILPYTSASYEDVVVQFTATSTSTNVFFQVNSATAASGDSFSLMSIAVTLVAADRSINSNPLVPVGTVNRVAVAAGAELVAFDGFFANSSYLKLFNLLGTLNFAAGDFSVSALVKWTGGNDGLFHFTDQSSGAGTALGNTAFWAVQIFNTGQIYLAARDASGSGGGGLTSGAVLSLNTWAFVVCCKRGTKLETWVNGKLVGIWTAPVGSLSNAAAILLIGCQWYDGAIGYYCKSQIVSPKLGALAPVPDQIAAWAVDELAMLNGKILLQGGYIVQGLAEDRETGILYVAKQTGGADMFQGPSNKGTILSTATANLFPGSGSTVTPWVGFGASIGARVVGASNWGNGTLQSLIEDSSTGGHWFYNGNVVIPASSHTILVPIRAGSRGFAWIYVQASNSSVFVNLATGATNAPVNCTALASLNLGNGIWGGQIVVTGTGAATQVRVYSTPDAATISFAGNNGAGGAAIFVGDPMIRAGSTALTASDFVFGTTRNDNHKSVSASDGHVIVGTGAGADVVMPALPLRSGVRARRPLLAYDPDFSRFNGRVTTDVTPTFIGNAFYIPEGGGVDFVISVDAKTPGGTATERAKYFITGSAFRNIGDTNATVSTQLNRPTDDETTVAFDCVVASVGGGWVNVRGTGKAATTLEWFGSQDLSRSAS